MKTQQSEPQALRTTPRTWGLPHDVPAAADPLFLQPVGAAVMDGLCRQSRSLSIIHGAGLQGKHYSKSFRNTQSLQ